MEGKEISKKIVVVEVLGRKEHGGSKGGVWRERERERERFVERMRCNELAH